jgi:16S rRNA (adenine1518-N6/adenine1519-N6)-dimethyltransferase
MGDLLDKTILLINDFKLNDLDAYGQNFLVDETIIKKEVASAELKKEDVVLDIGTGFGYLLEEIKKMCDVIGVEKDVKIFSYLLNKYELSKEVKLINGDVLKIVFPPFTKIVSNPPYTIVDRILNKLTRYVFDSGVMILPKTIADGLTGPSKTNKFFITQKIFFDFKEVMEVPKEAFYPAPRVISKMIKFEKRPYDFIQGIMKRDEMTVKNAILRSHQELGDKTKRESKEFLAGLDMEKLKFKDKEIKSLTTDELTTLISFVEENYSALLG